MWNQIWRRKRYLPRREQKLAVICKRGCCHEGLEALARSYVSRWAFSPRPSSWTAIGPKPLPNKLYFSSCSINRSRHRPCQPCNERGNFVLSPLSAAARRFDGNLRPKGGHVSTNNTINTIGDGLAWQYFFDLCTFLHLRRPRSAKNHALFLLRMGKICDFFSLASTKF